MGSEKTPTQLAIGYTAFAVSVAAAAYITTKALYAVFTAYVVRYHKELAEAEAQELRKSPRQFTPSELAKHDGRNPRHCLFMAVKGRVIDVHELGAEFYGPGGPYKHLAGRDGSKALALMSLKAEDAIADLAGLTEDQLEVLDDWAKKLYEKYPLVGQLVPERPATSS
ncbi:cytochrome b5-like heme/steroid binding domain-containing protein [Pavlovales sp. CCMP2436]|nr:cytochrome b5-like heme/steroid binding domain-containing protein [Pavlovales sp. CCMP2436]